MLIKTLRKLLPAVVLSCVAYNAQAGAVTYELTVFGGLTGSGSFIGTDSDVDGFLRMNELSAFTFAIPGVIDGVGLSNLTDFGSYQISGNVWNPDAADYLGIHTAYFSFNADGFNEELSISTDNTSFMATTPVAEQDNDVPEPASLTLFGLGLAAAGLARRRKKAA